MTTSPLCCRCRVNPRQHPSNPHCGDCRRAYQKAARQERRFCACGEKLAPRSRKCEACKKAAKEREAILCAECGAETSWHPGKKWCAACRMEKEKEAGREAIRRRDRKRAAAKQAAGKFCRCGVRLPNTRRGTCDECLREQRYWKKKAHGGKRRAQKKGTTVGRVSYKKVWADANSQCCRCGIAVTKETGHVDHIIALARGGPHRQENLQLLCAPCNQAKGCDG